MNLRDQFLGTFTHPGAIALGIAMLYPIGLVFHAAFDDPRIFRQFHDAERAHVKVTGLQKVRSFPARWQASVAWTDESKAQRTAQLEVSPARWWKTDAPGISTGESTDILVSRSQAGATSWRKDPPNVAPSELLGVQFNAETLALAFLFSFAGLTGMVGLRAMSGGAHEESDADTAEPGVVARWLGKVLDYAMTGFLVLIMLVIIVACIAYAAGFNVLKWLGIDT